MGRDWGSVEPCQDSTCCQSGGDASTMATTKVERLLQQGEHSRECMVSSWRPPNAQGSNGVIDNPVIKEIAEKYGKTTAQVILRWGLEQGVSVLPKSYNKGRITQNFQVFDWSFLQKI